MADGFVQNLGTAGSSATGTTLAITIGAGVTVKVGDYVIVAWTGGAASPGTVSCADSGTNTYSIVTNETATLPFSWMFIARVTTALQNPNTITVSNTTSVGGRAMSVSQYTGLISASPTDRTKATNFATGTSQTVTNAAANVQDNDLVVAGWLMGNVTTANAASGYTLRGKGASTGTPREAMLFDKVVNAVETSSCNQTWTTSVTSTGLLATFKLQQLRPRRGIVYPAAAQNYGFQ